ncbi:MAG: hypothetical protein K2I32_06985 [Alistipes sp.]|nr:hypothetical protein [Alistipes sp.]
MIDIDKKADLFGMENDDGFAVMNDDKRDGFKAGAEWMREELTRWHDAQIEPPELYVDVLLKMRIGSGVTIYRVGWLDEDGQWIVNYLAAREKIIGWRYIRE